MKKFHFRQIYISVDTLPLIILLYSFHSHQRIFCLKQVSVIRRFCFLEFYGILFPSFVKTLYHLTVGNIFSISWKNCYTILFKTWIYILILQLLNIYSKYAIEFGNMWTNDVLNNPEWFCLTPWYNTIGHSIRKQYEHITALVSML